MAEVDHYDAIIIGSGQSGGPLSTALVAAGRRTALVERVHIGGCCINEGCTPTKTMVASARVAYLARRSADYGVHVGDVTVKMREVRERTRAIVTSFREGSTASLKEGGVDILRGEGRFLDPRTLEVRSGDGGPMRYTADLFVINTGCRPAPLSLEGIEDVSTLDSTSIMELAELPEHLIILGGGYIGLEFAQMFRRFGSRVTVIERGPRLAAREDEEISDALSDILREDGIDVVLRAEAQRISQDRNGTVHLEMTTPEGARTIEGSHLLVAAGRTPNTESLNPSAAGVETTRRGFIRVDERLRTTAPHIYATGDVAGQPQFTHISYDDFRILRDNLIEGKDRTTTGRLVPYTVFTDPQLGRVGMTESEARAAGREIKVASMPMAHVARALEMDESRGLVKVVVDAGSGEILGAAVLGIEGGEVMAMLEIAMLGKVPYTVLRDAIWAHPTLAELLNNLFSAM
jgi:pyruvate/2-oxoglutarate dehydrogenase complex dihydrolipoamide dehydrogenase (E3) component